MFDALFRFVFKLLGWKINPNLPDEVNRCVLIASPHTSYGDFIYMRAAFTMLGIPMRFTVKDETNRFPLNKILTPMGALYINRRPKKPGEKRISLVEAMINFFKEEDRLAMAVTPEGTRSLRTEWKSGFYHVATGAGVPIVLGYLDYDKKTAGVGGVIHPSGDMEADLRKIAAFYQNIGPRHPERFSIDQRYAPPEMENDSKIGQTGA